jgi:hypothetical protein
MTTQSKAGLHVLHRRTLLVVSLVVVLVCCLFVYILNNNDSVIDYTGPIHVKTEAKLVTAVNGAPSGVQVVIALANDIKLTDVLSIPEGVNITLTSSGNKFFNRNS